MLGRYFITITLAFLSISGHGQISRGGSPMLPYLQKKAYNTYKLSEQAIKHEIENIFDQGQNEDDRKNYVIAVDQKVDLSPENSGNWIDTNKGIRIWRLEIFSKDAKGLSLFFEDFKLERDVMIFLYDPELDVILGGFNHQNNKKYGFLQTAFVPGERIIIEMQVKGSKGSYGKFSIGSVSHAFVDVFGTGGERDGFYGTSGFCQRDVSCSEGDEWQLQRRAVCRVFYKVELNRTEICSGSLINNTAEDGKPYFYTANHSIGNGFEASTAVFYFGYEAQNCEGEDVDAIFTISAADIVATSDSLDFSLLLLSDNPPESYKPYFAGWSLSEDPPMKSVAIHHPRGDVKKISVDNDPALVEYQLEDPPLFVTQEPIKNSMWRVESWETGATEGGSSGSPLFNDEKLIVGNLRGGVSDCFIPENDYFSKFYLHWDYHDDPQKQLKIWLDSEGKAVSSLQGHDPYDIQNSVEHLSNGRRYFNEIINHPKFDPQLYGKLTVKIYNLQGALLSVKYSTPVDFPGNFLCGFGNGIYIIELSNEYYSERHKIFIINKS
jgi:hypothetical protein